MAPAKTQMKAVKAEQAAKTKATKATKAKVVEEAEEAEETEETEEADESPFPNTVPNALLKEVHTTVKEYLTISEKDLKFLLNVMMYHVVEKVKEGGSVCFRKNFTIQRVVRAARTFHHMQTGEPIFKDDRYTLRIDIKPELKKEMEQMSLSKQDKAAIKATKAEKAKATKAQKAEKPKKTKKAAAEEEQDEE